MYEYDPDNWLIYKLSDSLYKVVAGWSGGYLDGDYWRINSGITKIEEAENIYSVYGESGSIYHLRKSAELYRQNIAPIVGLLDKKGYTRTPIADIKEMFI